MTKVISIKKNVSDGERGWKHQKNVGQEGQHRHIWSIVTCILHAGHQWLLAWALSFCAVVIRQNLRGQLWFWNRTVIHNKTSCVGRNFLIILLAELEEKMNNIQRIPNFTDTKTVFCTVILLNFRYISQWMTFYNQGWPGDRGDGLSLPEHTQTQWFFLVGWLGDCNLHVSVNKWYKDNLEKKHASRCLKTFYWHLQVRSRICQDPK